MKQTKRERTAQILTAAVKLAIQCGYAQVTREAIASKIQVSPALVTHHMGTMEQLRRSLMREAIRLECLPIIAQGLVARDRHAAKAPPELKQAALAYHAF